jgi:SHS2 domain-containing protein
MLKKMKFDIIDDGSMGDDNIIENKVVDNTNSDKFMNDLGIIRLDDGNQDKVEEEIRYRYLDHMTDLIVVAYGKNIAECFENSAIATINAMFDIIKVKSKTRIKIVANGFDLKSLLYDWIEKILLAIYIDKIVINHFEYIHVKRILKDSRDRILRNEIISFIPNSRNDPHEIGKNNVIDLNSKNKNYTYEMEGMGIGEAPPGRPS